MRLLEYDFGNGIFQRLLVCHIIGGLAAFPRTHFFQKLRRADQAAYMRGQNSIGAALHRGPPQGLNSIRILRIATVPTSLDACTTAGLQVTVSGINSLVSSLPSVHCCT